MVLQLPRNDASGTGLASPPPLPAVSVKSQPQAEEDLLPEQLVTFLENAERPDPATHLIGTELEKFGVAVGAPGEPLRPVDYDEHIAPVLAALVRDHGWEVGKDRGESGEIVELVRDGASITLEPGGQLELSGAPLHNVHQTCAEFTDHYRELHAISEPLGLAWFTAGHHPWATREEIAIMPKGRYRVMRSYLPTRGSMGLDMMLRTCTVQANFDYGSERQCAERLRMMSSIAPVVMAIFSNSPYREGEKTPFHSWRSRVWTDVDPARCGVRPFFFEGFSYERYVDWALDVPMFFLKRDGVYHPHHPTFREFMRDGFETPDGARHRARWSDWTTHLSTLFPEVRLKPYLEFRSADAVGSRYVCALPALLKGLLYDEQATAEAWELTAPLRYEDRSSLMAEAAEQGLGSPRIRGFAAQLLRLARAALDRHDVRDSKGRTESRFLDRLDPLVERGRSPADEVADLLGDAPGRDVEAQYAFVRAYHFAGALG